MKRLIIIMCTLSTLMVAQEDCDAAGQYKLSGVNVLYTFVTRAENTLTVTDAYGLGITQAIATIPASVPFTTQAMQLTDAALSAVGINLNVTLNPDCSGSVAEGSYYPDVNTITDENGNCVTLQQVLPVTDNFAYLSNGDLNLSAGGKNVLGQDGISNQSGLGGLELDGSSTFEDFPMNPYNPTICGPDTSCFAFMDDVDGDGQIIPEIYGGVDLYTPAGAPLAGVTGGFFKKVGLNTDDLESVFPGNTDPDFYLEWHGVDGFDSGLGCGSEDDCMGGETTDEDDDDTWFDREVGIPAVTATFINPACGYNLPIFGDVAAYFPPECVDYVDLAASGYLMDPSLATWGNFLTANAAQFNGCIGQAMEMGMDVVSAQGYCAANYPGWLADDSDHDFNGVDGRLTMNFDIPCVGIIEAREVIAEFIEVGGGECGNGDINGDGGHNVLDVVALVGCVLADTCTDCAGDINVDGSFDVLDVVGLVNCVLQDNCDGGARVDAATSAEFNVTGNEVTMTADGLVGGIQMTLSHGNNFALTLTDGMAWSLTDGNTTTLIIVNPEEGSLFTANGDFTIESVIVSDFTGESSLSASVNMPSDFHVNAAYPNPFNPTTQMSLTLNTAADVSVKVFNMNGQLIDMIANGKMSSGSYSFTWDGTNASSGVYFIQTEVGSEIQSQKIMLIK